MPDLARRWFVRVRKGHAEWIEGPFTNEDEARTHARLLTDQWRGSPTFSLRIVRLEHPDAEDVIERLADWIEANCEGVEVVRETGMVIT